jgi:DNA (cytosine-5)-methyltransferase 1
MAPYGVPRYGEREGQEPRTNDIQEPMPTVVTTGNGFQLCSAFMAQHNGGFNTTPGHPLEAPVSTICQSGANQQLVTSHLMIQRRNAFGRSMEEPSPTSTAHTNHLHAVTGHLEVMRNNANGQDVQEPAPTVCAQGTHLSVVLSFLTSFYGTGLGQDCRAPLRTVTTCDRFGVVTAHAAVEIDGQTYALSDIHMRMLAPRELYLAQGFPPEYVIDPILDGKPLTKTAQVRMCGNSVCPGLAAAIVSANYQPLEMQVAA